MKTISLILNIFGLIAIVTSHGYFRKPPSRGSEMAWVAQQQSGGYVDQYFFHSKAMSLIISLKKSFKIFVYILGGAQHMWQLSYSRSDECSPVEHPKYWTCKSHLFERSKYCDERISK